MFKFIFVVGIIIIAVALFFLSGKKRNVSRKIDTYKNIKDSLKQFPNETKSPIANIEELDMEVNNGGFNQYFFNSSGQNCFETLRELKRLGKNKKAELLEKAIDFINPNKLSEDTMIKKLRLRQVSELDDDFINVKLDSLDEIYFKSLE
jgi:hypothetical protein